MERRVGPLDVRKRKQIQRRHEETCRFTPNTRIKTAVNSTPSRSLTFLRRRRRFLLRFLRRDFRRRLRRELRRQLLRLREFLRRRDRPRRAWCFYVTHDCFFK
jgi:hypothetical protein